MGKDSCKTAFDRRVHSAAGHLPEPYSSQSIPEVLVADLMCLNKFYSEKPETQNADLITEEAAVGEGVVSKTLSKTKAATRTHAFLLFF